jgi:hypothetical protein
LLFERPVEVVEARDPEQVRARLQRLREAGERGLHAAGFLSYEAGHALEAKLAPLASAAAAEVPPLLWFGCSSGAAASRMLPRFCGRQRRMDFASEAARLASRIRDRAGGGEGAYRAGNIYRPT